MAVAWLKEETLVARSTPTPVFFRDAALMVLGEATHFKIGVFVDNKTLLDDILKRAGIDIANLDKRGTPEDGWILEGKGGLRDVAYGTIYRMGGTKITIPLTVPRGRGFWGLTEEGAKEALRLVTEARPQKQTKNITAEFLERRLKATGGIEGHLWNLFRTTLKAHLTISDTTDRIDDHIQTGLMRLISRDALRERLMSGQAVEDTQLSNYILRSAYNDCRDEGTEPTSREMYGALTEKERATGVKRGPVADSRVIWAKNSDRWDTATITEIKDTGSPMSTEAVQDAIYFEECWEKIEAIVREKKPHAWRRYVQVLKQRVEAFRVKEIAEGENVSPYRAASIIAEARRVVREAEEEGKLDFI